MQRYIRFSVPILLIVLLVPALVSASDTPLPHPSIRQQSAGEVTYDTQVEGEITSSAISQNWSLSNVTADRISVQVERVDGNLIPELYILDANGSILTGSNGADQTFAAASISSYTLPSAGSYQIQVGRKDTDSGATSGKYNLTVYAEGTALDNPNNANPVGEIAYGIPQSGDINGSAWRKVYTLTTDAPDNLIVTVDRTAGNLVPYVDVIDSAGSVLATGYPNSQDTQAQTSLSLPTAGQYSIAVSRESGQSGETSGSYSVQVDLIGAGDGAASLATPAGTITYDTPVTGEITGTSRYQDWQLTTTGTDTLTIEVQRSGEGSTLQPEVIVLGGSGQEINHGYANPAGDVASIQDYTLDAAGSYTVRVTRASGQTGESTGGYTLTVKLIGSGADSPELAPKPESIITADTPVTGEVTGLRWADTWTFTAAEGQTYNLKARRTSGTLVPFVRVLDSTGQKIFDTYPDPGFDTVAGLGYNFPAAGDYQIVVYRYNEQYGYTTGGYELVVSISTGQ